jgi:D-arabinose 1-dehydrogenase-like Zn-dependent alcohol dehydrogenase
MFGGGVPKFCYSRMEEVYSTIDKLQTTGAASFRNFCAEHWVVSDVKVIPIQKVNEAYE